MTRRIDRLRGAGGNEERFTLDSLAQMVAMMGYDGHTYPLGLNTTWQNQPAEAIGNNFSGYTSGAYRSDGPVFSAITARQLLLSEIRFQWQTIIPRPGDLYGNTELRILEQPWPNGTTSDLIRRMEAHNSLAGNAYVYRDRRANRLRMLRPDWVTVIVGSQNPDPTVTPSPHDLESELVGYVYQPGGYGSKAKPITLMPADVAHWAPIPDPEGAYVGMSWVTPVLREVQGDKAATLHKLRFFENAATPNLAIKYPKEVQPEALQQYLKLLDEEHKGATNAYKTLHLGGGADPMVIGTDLKQLDFKTTQGAGESRIAAASQIPAVILGFSEGMDAATYSNFGQARRLTGDKFLRPMWRSLAGALQSILTTPGDSRLWYDAADVSFLQEDERDSAEILAQQAMTIRQLTDAGYTPESVVAAVQANDLTKLAHSGLFSVQLQAAGAAQPTA